MRLHLHSCFADVFVVTGYLMALIAMLAAMAIIHDSLRGGIAAMAQVTPVPSETTGAGGEPKSIRIADYTTWRMTPEESQKRFATPGVALLPPTPIAEVPRGWVPSYAAAAKKHALENSIAWPLAQRDPGRSAPVAAPLEIPGQPVTTRAMTDTQMGGR
jgi:hypothetical protein